MIAFAIIDANGHPTGGGIRPALPEGAIALTPPWTTADLPRLRWTGAEWVERDVVPVAPTKAELAEREAAMLARARAEAVDRVNVRIDALRARIYTNITGQDALYLEKRAEAVAYIRQAEMSGEPGDLADYPLLAGEVGITAPTPWQLAQIWLHRSDQFKALGTATERVRMAAMLAISGASDLDGVETALADFRAALSTLTP